MSERDIAEEAYSFLFSNSSGWALSRERWCYMAGIDVSWLQSRVKKQDFFRVYKEYRNECRRKGAERLLARERYNKKVEELTLQEALEGIMP